MRVDQRSVVVSLLVIAMSATTCSSSDTGGSPSTSTPSDPTGPPATGTTGSSACELFTTADAEALFEGPVENVPDAVEQGLITASAIPAEADFCYYRPTPDDGARFAAAAIVPPGAVTEEEYAGWVEGGTALGGPRDDGFEVDGGIVTRVGDTYVLAIAAADTDGGNDPSAALEVAAAIVSRLTPPTPDSANLACRLLTEELAESAAGIDLAFRDDVAEERRSGCGYVGRSDPGSVILLVTQGPDAAAEYGTVRDSRVDDRGFRELEGVGEEAFTDGFDTYVLEGDTLMKVSIFVDGGPLVDEEITLAGELVARL